MNESPLPSDPKKSVVFPRTESTAPVNPPISFGLAFVLGVLLIIISIALCAAFQHPFPLIVGALVAFFSLFKPGYRGIFAGFVTVIGVAILAVVVICGSMGPSHI